MAEMPKTERGRRTRTRILDAAKKLFVAHGYVDTTMAAIAAEAGVSVQTLYLVFESKAAILLAAYEVTVVGDDAPVPMLERPWVDALRAEPDGLKAIRILMENVLAVRQRASAMFGVVQAASADPEVAAVAAENRRRRIETMRVLAGALATKDGFDPDLDVDRAADVLYTTISDELYRLVVADRGWPLDEWSAWATDIAADRLFPTVRSRRSSASDQRRGPARRAPRPSSGTPRRSSRRRT